MCFRLSFSILPVAVQLFQHHLLEKALLPPLTCFCIFVRNHLGVLLGISVALLHLSVCPPALFILFYF